MNAAPRTHRTRGVRLHRRNRRRGTEIPAGAGSRPSRKLEKELRAVRTGHPQQHPGVHKHQPRTAGDTLEIEQTEKPGTQDLARETYLNMRMEVKRHGKCKDYELIHPPPEALGPPSQGAFGRIAPVRRQSPRLVRSRPSPGGSAELVGAGLQRSRVRISPATSSGQRMTRPAATEAEFPATQLGTRTRSVNGLLSQLPTGEA